MATTAMQTVIELVKSKRITLIKLIKDDDNSEIERPLKRPRIGRFTRPPPPKPSLAHYKTKRPPLIETSYCSKEVKRIFTNQWHKQHNFFNYHLKNGKGFVHYTDDGYEDEGLIMMYYEHKGNKPGISPFDLLYSDKDIYKINKKQLEWEKSLQSLVPQKITNQPWRRFYYNII